MAIILLRRFLYWQNWYRWGVRRSIGVDGASASQTPGDDGCQLPRMYSALTTAGVDGSECDDDFEPVKSVDDLGSSKQTAEEGMMTSTSYFGVRVMALCGSAGA